LPIPATVTVPPDAKLVFRPQDTTIGPVAGEASAVPGKVVHREFLGSVVRYGLRVGESEVIVDAPFRTGDTLHEPDAAVSVYIPLGSALWLSA
jgi:iron(III) transport system ATP-binding protein